MREGGRAGEGACCRVDGGGIKVRAMMWGLRAGIVAGDEWLSVRRKMLWDEEALPSTNIRDIRRATLALLCA